MAVVRDLCLKHTETNDKGNTMNWSRLAHATVQLMSPYMDAAASSGVSFDALQPRLLQALRQPQVTRCPAAVWDCAVAIATCGFKTVKVIAAMLASFRIPIPDTSIPHFTMCFSCGILGPIATRTHALFPLFIAWLSGGGAG